MTEDIKIVYCPTEAMLADFFTKPLQGALFRRLREVIMGRKHLRSLSEFITPKERVENTNFPKVKSFVVTNPKNERTNKQDSKFEKVVNQNKCESKPSRNHIYVK